MLRYLLLLPVTAVLPVVLVLSSTALAQAEIPPEALVRMAEGALTSGRWGPLMALGIVGLVAVLRKAGSKRLPVLDSPRGAVALSMAGGTASALALALFSGHPFTLGLLSSCLMTAASASGLWSWGQTIGRKPGASTICTPQEIANGTCRPG